MYNLHDKQKVYYLHGKGLSHRSIAKETGIPKSTIGDWLKELNIQPEYRQPKVLFWDIETSLMLATIWRTGQQYVGVTQIKQDWFMHCASWAWNDEEVQNVSQIHDIKRFTRNVTDDYHVVKTCWDLMSEADIVVHHNGNRFDYPKLLARAIYHDLKPIQEPLFVDTLNLARKAGFTSKALGALGIHLSLDEKAESKYEWWQMTLDGCIDHHEKMLAYCDRDIPPLRSLFKKLRPYFPKQIPNVNLFTGDDFACPVCASQKIEMTTQRCKGKTQIVSGYKCCDCGAHFDDGKNLRRGLICR